MMKKVKGIIIYDSKSSRSGFYRRWQVINCSISQKREVSEEIHNNFNITADDLVELFTFKEHAASDPNKMIEMTVFLSKKKIDVPLTTNEEILHYHWYKIGEDYNISSSIKDHFLPYAEKNNLIY